MSDWSKETEERERRDKPSGLFLWDIIDMLLVHFMLFKECQVFSHNWGKGTAGSGVSLSQMAWQPGTVAATAKEMPKIAEACPDHHPMFFWHATHLLFLAFTSLLEISVHYLQYRSYHLPLGIKTNNSLKNEKYRQKHHFMASSCLDCFGA